MRIKLLNSWRIREVNPVGGEKSIRWEGFVEHVSREPGMKSEGQMEGESGILVKMMNWHVW